MRRTVSTAMLLTLFCLISGLTALAQQASTVQARSVGAATDSSGVSITILQSGTNLAMGEDDGQMTIFVESSIDGSALTCTLSGTSSTGDITINADHTVEVSWDEDSTDVISITLPSIRIAALLANFECA